MRCHVLVLNQWLLTEQTAIHPNKSCTGVIDFQIASPNAGQRHSRLNVLCLVRNHNLSNLPHLLAELIVGSIFDHRR